MLEAGPGPGHAVRQWGHVRMFSPWGFNTDPAARALLEASGWQTPEPDDYPTGADLVARYVEPLAAALAAAGADLRFGARVVGVSRRHQDRLRDGNVAAGFGRAAAPFVLHVAAPDGGIVEVEAGAVIDASGTWTSPSPAGAHGLPAPGEAASADRIAYGIPDVLGAARAAYADATTLVVGGGHSAMNAVLDLAALAREAPGTRVLWAFRRPLAAVNFGGGAADGLAARGALGEQARALVEAGRVEALAPFLVHRVEAAGDGLVVHGERDGRTEARRIDRMVVATGFRPDLLLPRGTPPRARSGGADDARAGAADRPERPLLRHGAPARRGRASPPGRAGLLHGGHEVVRPGADLPARDGARAGAQHRRLPRRGRGGGAPGRTGAARDRRVLDRPPRFSRRPRRGRPGSGDGMLRPPPRL